MRSALTRLLNRFSRWSPAVVAVLATGGLLVSIFFLLWRGTSSELTERADLSVAVATMFALFAAIAAITALIWVESSDYKAQQAVKADTAQVRAGLRSILVKGVQLKRPDRKPATCLTFEKEREVINEFLSSTTAFGFWSWVDDKSDLAGSKQEEWRVFFLYFAELLDACDTAEDNEVMFARAVWLDDMLHSLSRRDVNAISSHVADLAGALGTPSRNVLLQAMAALYPRPAIEREEAGGMDSAEVTAAKFRHLKQKGVVDPNVDMFVGVFDGDAEAVKAALEAGADPSVTDREVLAAHEAELADFRPR